MYSKVKVTLADARQLEFRNVKVSFVGSFVLLTATDGNLTAMPADVVVCVDASGLTQDN